MSENQVIEMIKDIVVEIKEDVKVVLGKERRNSDRIQHLQFRTGILWYVVFSVIGLSVITAAGLYLWGKLKGIT